MKQCDLTKGLVAFLTIMIILFCGLMPSAWAEDSVVAKCNCCEDGKVEGCFRFSDSGMMLMRILNDDGTPAVDDDGNPLFSQKPTPMSSLGIIFLDGKNAKGREVMTFGGISVSADVDGKFQLGPDCMGRARICVSPNDGSMPIESEVIVVMDGCNFDNFKLMTTKMTLCNSDVVVALPLNIIGSAERLECQSCDDDDDDDDDDD